MHLQNQNSKGIAPNRETVRKPGKVLCCTVLFAILGVEKPGKVLKVVTCAHTLTNGNIHHRQCSLCQEAHKAVTFCFHCALSLATTVTMFQQFHPACRLQVFLGLLTALLPSGLHPNASRAGPSSTQYTSNPSPTSSSYLISDSVCMLYFNENRRISIM